jgi:hypothetical protein
MNAMVREWARPANARRIGHIAASRAHPDAQALSARSRLDRAPDRIA